MTRADASPDRAADHDPPPAEDGGRTADRDTRPTDDSERTAGRGTRPTDDSERTADCGTRPTDDSRHTADRDTRPTDDSERAAGRGGRVLVVTAVAAEADAVRAGDPAHRLTVEPVGVGPAAAAAGTARLLALAEAAGTPFAAVISAGIAGGFPGRAAIGATVLGTRSVAADLGAETPAGFLPVTELGFGADAVDAGKALLAALRPALPGAVTGAILTLATVTGTAATADRLAAAHPDAVAEAMEGFGVATAAAAAGVPFAELRTISNPIGPRDRTAWRLREAFAALTAAVPALITATQP